MLEGSKRLITNARVAKLYTVFAKTDQSAGLRVLVTERLLPNDGGVGYGQAAVAAATT